MNGLYDELRLAIHSIWARRWVVLAVAWAVCLIGWFLVAQIPATYVAKARVSVQIQSILPGKIGITPDEQAKGIDRVRQTLTSAVNLTKVVRGTDLANTVANERDVQDRVTALQAAIKVVAQQDNLFEISATSSSPKLAKQIVQKTIDIFIEENLQGDRDETNTTLQFLEGQLAARQKQLQDSEAKRAEFQNRYMGSLPGTGSLNDRISAARTQLSQVETDLAAAQSGLAILNGQLASTSATTGGSGGGTAGPARARVVAIQGQIAEARARGWTDAHPDVRALNAQLALAMAAARNEPLSAGAAAQSNPLYAGLKAGQAEKAAQVAALVARKTQIQNDLNQLQAKLTGDPAVAAEQAQLERDYAVLKDQYDKLLADREEIKLRGQVQNQSGAIRFEVVDPPSAPRTPSAPNRPMLLSGVLLAGIVAGVGAAFALGQLRTTFATAQRLERVTGMPVIGSVGAVIDQATVKLKRQRLLYFAGGMAGLVCAYVALIGVEFLQRGMAA
ncbi:XrtA system polysaccharide chain length determinant [Sphingomonas sp.]|uniref:XrtA system polysaccharide chain length determinant n=1 Tax=Sphingomonas sp. TaxID=28214 RepID=UPI001D7142D2|nr:XrtA system polysaccharide chain length determinant [Sphingomonas sp.]MBX9796331.1 chain-length determining protein [Sphingomonas sp.]